MIKNACHFLWRRSQSAHRNQCQVSLADVKTTVDELLFAYVSAFADSIALALCKSLSCCRTWTSGVCIIRLQLLSSEMLNAAVCRRTVSC